MVQVLEDTTTTTPILSQINFLGQGFDIFGVRDINIGTIRSLFDLNKAPTQTLQFLGNTFQIPSCIDARENTSVYIFDDVADSREQYQSNLALNVGVSGSYGAFSGEMRASYSNEFERSSQFMYASHNHYLTVGVATLQNAIPFLSQEFLDAVAKLPDTVSSDNEKLFDTFFTKFGVYYVQKILLGGSVELYTSIKKSSNLSKEQIGASFKAEYDGVLVKGKIDGDIAVSQAFQSYKNNRSTTIKAIGGGLAEVENLARINPESPSDTTAERFADWAKTVGSDPAIVDYRLGGIWELCGSKRQLVEEAWDHFGKRMHPRLTIRTPTAVDSKHSQMSGVGASVTLNGVDLTPPEPPTFPNGFPRVGFQALILDSHGLENPTVLFNHLFFIPNENLPPKTPGYKVMYDNLYQGIHDSGVNTAGNILILASVNLDLTSLPHANVSNLLLTAGAGEQFKDWFAQTREGAVEFDNFFQTTFPLNYLLVGKFGIGPDDGIEKWERVEKRAPTSTLEVFFYRHGVDDEYTFGPA